MGFSKEAKNKALLATIFLLIAGVFGFWWISDSGKKMNDALPLMIFYIILILNTFYSIRCFATVTPKHRHEQKIIDVMLICLYLILALSLGNPSVFIFISCLVFALATLKYTLLLNLTDHNHLLRRKIYIDSLGIIACLLALGGVALGYQAIASWLWATTFIMANIYVILLKPLYKIPEL